MKYFFAHGARAVLFLVIFTTLGAYASLRAATAYGVTTSNQLIRFDTSSPGTVTTVGPITGLQSGENIVGIDFRPANGQLYALGSSSRLYTISLTSPAATQVGTTGAFTLSGTDFGFDFNPTVDRIRIVSNTGQNLRVNPNDGTLTATDTPLGGIAPNVTAAAYSGSFAGATTTTLYDIDTTTNALYTQNPPNNGTLNLVGPLGVIASSTNGFDIGPFGGQAFAALTVGGTTGLYTINLGTGTATLVGPIGTGTNTLRGLSIQFGSSASTVLDYDGDRRADYAIFRPSNTTYYISRSSNPSSIIYSNFGLATDVQTPGDYDGDGRTDIAVWRPSNGVFYVLRSSDGGITYYRFGTNGDEPVARDYDGDGKTDFAVVRRTGNAMIWYIANSSNGTFRAEQFGFASDVTAPGDYDGDGRFDLAIYRGDNQGYGTFYLQRSTAGFTAIQYGLGSDLVVPGDYDGDGKTDLAVTRQGSRITWYVLRSSDNNSTIVQFGAKPQYTAQADYDGDGRTDIATFDPINGVFFVFRSAGFTTSAFRFGSNGDFPIANYDTH